MHLDDDAIVNLGAGGFVMRDGYLGPAAARAVAACARARLPGLRPAGVGRERQRLPATRGDAIGWIDSDDPAPPLQPLLEGFATLQRSLNQGAYLGLRRFELQLAAYPGGGARYERHRDALAGSDGRVATAIYYLNDWTEADGGVLRLHIERGPAVDVPPLLDRLLIFLSDRVEHEVLPVHAERLAITAWYRRDLP